MTLTLRPLDYPRRVYCAGPLFNAAERREMSRIAAVLADAGFEPFVPHADGMEFAQVHPYLVAQGYDSVEIGRLLHEAIFALDVYQVAAGCGSLVMNLNGRTPDEGAVAELSIAWTLGKPIVIFKEDARSAIAGRDNPLVVGQTDFETVREIDRLSEALEAAIADAAARCDAQVVCAPRLSRAVRAGEKLWRGLQSLGAERPADAVAEQVLALFGPRSAAAVGQ